MSTSHANPHPLDAAARDELARKFESLKQAALAAKAESERGDFDVPVRCSPDRILALLAAVERGEADTARLNWLFSDLTSDEINAKVEDVESAFMKLGRYDHDAFRAAIDAARAHPEDTNAP